MLELQLALMVMMLTIVGIMHILVTHERIVASMESSLAGDPIYYVVPPREPLAYLAGVRALLEDDPPPPRDPEPVFEHAVLVHGVTRELGPFRALATVRVDDALQDIIDDLQAILGNDPGQPWGTSITSARAKLVNAQTELGQPTPDMVVVFSELVLGTTELEGAIDNYGFDAGAGHELGDRISEVSHPWAVDEVDAAIAQSGDPVLIALAQQALADSDTEQARGEWKLCAAAHKVAVEKAQESVP